MGEWIKANRQAKNLTPGQLGAKMGIAHSVVRSWEEGLDQPSTIHIATLERFFERNYENLSAY